jgi:hypothetical protein
LCCAVMGGRRYSNSQSSRVIHNIAWKRQHTTTVPPFIQPLRGLILCAVAGLKLIGTTGGWSRPHFVCLPLNQVALRLWPRSLKFPLSTRQTASTPRLAVSPSAALGFSAWTGPLFKQLIMRVRVLPSDRSRIARMENQNPL